MEKEELERMLNRFLTERYDDIVKMAEKITQDPEYREIAHFAIEQFMNNDKALGTVERGEAMSFLSGIIYRNYHSTTSPYHRIYRMKGKEVLGGYQEYDFRNFDLIHEEYDTDTDLMLDAIEGVIEDMLAEENHIWYIATLFRMWIETPNYSELERRTRIPRTSISQAVNEARNYIQQKLKENGYY